MKKIKLALDWTPNINHIGFFVAYKKNFYREFGIDIKIIIGFPPLLDHPDYSNPTYKRAFAKLHERLSRFGFEVIGKPEDFLYPIEYMHDTRYHLHSKARDIHTKKIEAKLCSGLFRCQ